MAIEFHYSMCLQSPFTVDASHTTETIQLTFRENFGSSHFSLLVYDMFFFHHITYSLHCMIFTFPLFYLQWKINAPVDRNWLHINLIYR